jgi:hypothetical protein
MYTPAQQILARESDKFHRLRNRRHDHLAKTSWLRPDEYDEDELSVALANVTEVFQGVINHSPIILHTVGPVVIVDPCSECPVRGTSACLMGQCPNC